MEINYNNRLTTAGFTICPNLGQVIIGKKTQSISPVNMKVLMLLLKKQGQVVSRSQLFDEVWTNQEVSDETLTRCISDLRAQVGKEHIKTLPKRGYQWIPQVSQATDKPIKRTINNRISGLIAWIIMAVLGLFALSVSSLWIAEKIIQPNQVRIALLPFETKTKKYTEMANHLESTLKAEVIKSEKLKLLSSSVTIGNLEKPYPYLNREYGARWIIEGQISNYQNDIKVILSLVDARTALIVFSMTSKFDADEISFLSFCQKFVKRIP